MAARAWARRARGEPRRRLPVARGGFRGPLVAVASGRALPVTRACQWPRWCAAGSGAGEMSAGFAEIRGLRTLLGEAVAVRARPEVVARRDDAVGPASVGLDPVVSSAE